MSPRPSSVGVSSCVVEVEPSLSMKFAHFVTLVSLIAVSDASDGYLEDATQCATRPAKRLMIDTDAGVDDGLAIFNILGAEDLLQNVKVELITTVTGNTHVGNVGRNVLKILRTAQRLDIPVYGGANESILYAPKFDNYFGEDGFGDVDFPNPPSEDLIKKKHAANALVEAAALNPGQLTLVCLGPLTNIALAARLDPKFMSNLKDLFVLGGSDSGVGNIKPGVEFNFYVDPEAAYVALEEARRNRKLLNLLTWETVYVRSTIDMAWRKEVLGAVQSRQVELINEAERPTLEGTKWVCADCALSAVVLDGDVVEDSVICHVQVELCGRHSRAAVFVDDGSFHDPSGHLRLIKRINVDKFKKMLLQNLNFQRELTNDARRTL